MESDKQNLAILLNKLNDMYRDDILINSNNLLSLDLGEKAYELFVPISEDVGKYDILIPIIDADVLFPTLRASVVGKYFQMDNGFIVRNELKDLVINSDKPYVPPEKVYIAIDQIIG
jgi:hypothetical protein